MNGRWRERVEEAFRHAAEAVGGSYDDRSYRGRPVVQKRVDEWIVTLVWEELQQGPHTLMRAPFHNADRFRFAVRDERLMDDLLKTFGFLQDVTVGDEAFDRRFVVKGFPTARLKSLLDARVRELLEAQKSVDLRVLPPTGYPTVLPPGVEELQFREAWAITDPERLVGLFDLFDELLPRLAGADHEADDEVEVLVRWLEGPGGTFRPPSGRVVLWDGDTPRRDAAARLGATGDRRAVEPLLSALGDEDDEVVAAAIRSLGELGDRRALAPLVALLGERGREVDGAPLGGTAARALEALGRGEVAGAFERALEGDPEPLRSGAGEHRGAVVEALMAVVDSVDFAARVEAARALGALGATEALPLLRSKSNAWGMQTRLTESAAAAVEEIEARAALPRPADAAPERADTHPRPADASSDDRSTLPRSANEGGS